ncbi:hypothetical protein ANANG_G00067750 [Anguilla anguilla]|uniref:Uncharacterized protein n=1 Tax=Anguilla anguilla TaxID=7936 RepID=A0A9D3MQ19_ANGAN|nr:hypothetical protein ANANG_G00067750 [Anguilla anguilla]
MSQDITEMAAQIACRLRVVLQREAFCHQVEDVEVVLMMRGGELQRQQFNESTGAVVHFCLCVTKCLQDAADLDVKITNSQNSLLCIYMSCVTAKCKILINMVVEIRQTELGWRLNLC